MLEDLSVDHAEFTSSSLQCSIKSLVLMKWEDDDRRPFPFSTSADVLVDVGQG